MKNLENVSVADLRNTLLGMAESVAFIREHCEAGHTAQAIDGCAFLERNLAHACDGLARAENPHGVKMPGPMPRAIQRYEIEGNMKQALALFAQGDIAGANAALRGEKPSNTD